MNTKVMLVVTVLFLTLCLFALGRVGGMVAVFFGFLCWIIGVLFCACLMLLMENADGAENGGG